MPSSFWLDKEWLIPRAMAFTDQAARVRVPAGGHQTYSGDIATLVVTEITSIEWTVQRWAWPTSGRGGSSSAIFAAGAWGSLRREQGDKVGDEHPWYRDNMNRDSGTDEKIHLKSGMVVQKVSAKRQAAMHGLYPLGNREPLKILERRCLYFSSLRLCIQD